MPNISSFPLFVYVAATAISGCKIFAKYVSDCIPSTGFYKTADPHRGRSSGRAHRLIIIFISIAFTVFHFRIFYFDLSGSRYFSVGKKLEVLPSTTLKVHVCKKINKHLMKLPEYLMLFIQNHQVSSLIGNKVAETCFQFSASIMILSLPFNVS